MNFPSDLSTPWLFQRDELDLLEQEFESARRRALHGRHRVIRRVLDEQEKTEAAAQDELERALEPFHLDSSCPMHGEHDCTDHEEEDRSLDDMLQDGLSKDPLTVRAYRWLVFIREHLPRTSRESWHRLRIVMNAPLVLAKISFAADELELGDEPSKIIASKELELAGVYLTRVIESTEALAKNEGVSQAVAGHLLQEAAVLLPLVQKRRAKLHHSPTSRL